MFVIHRKDIKRNGNNPTLLRLFGTDRGDAPPAFDRTIFPWLDRGGIVAIAHVRGDGGFGREWWDAGRLGNKGLALDDFSRAARKLIDARYTNSSKLALGGQGADGLPAYALLVDQPKLAAAAVFDMPIADLLRFDQMRAARRLVSEFGSPEDPATARQLLDISPYANIKKGVTYPSVLITTDQADASFGPMHAWKLAARLQSASPENRTVFVQTLIRAGQGTSKPLSARLSEASARWVFLMDQLGMINSEDKPHKP